MIRDAVDLNLGEDKNDPEPVNEEETAEKGSEVPIEFESLDPIQTMVIKWRKKYWQIEGELVQS